MTTTWPSSWATRGPMSEPSASPSTSARPAPCRCSTPTIRRTRSLLGEPHGLLHRPAPQVALPDIATSPGARGLHMSHIDGKVAVVTGAASGFGLLTAQRLADRGATVVGFDVTAADGCVVVDVTDLAAVRSAVDQVVTDHGRVDILVNNAGV